MRDLSKRLSTEITHLPLTSCLGKGGGGGNYAINLLIGRPQKKRRRKKKRHLPQLMRFRRGALSHLSSENGDAKYALKFPGRGILKKRKPNRRVGERGGGGMSQRKETMCEKKKKKEGNAWEGGGNPSKLRREKEATRRSPPINTAGKKGEQDEGERQKLLEVKSGYGTGREGNGRK